MNDQIEVVVSAVRAIARDILEIELSSKAQTPLPAATPGSHIDMHLPNGLVRQYSLVNALGGDNNGSYRVGVGLDVNSRGGSKYIHEKLRVGQILRISPPRNHFPLNPGHRNVLLLAGGIGVTPIMAMARFCEASNITCELWACARSSSRLAYYDELKAMPHLRLYTHFDDEKGVPLDLSLKLKEKQWDAVYACGPTPMLDALASATVHWDTATVVVERFKAPESKVDEDNNSFELVLTDSGITTQVESGESILEAMERVGAFVPSSCREGICGTCETKIIDGEVAHADYVLSEDEAQAQDRMLVCVSRCKGKRLVLKA